MVKTNRYVRIAAALLFCAAVCSSTRGLKSCQQHGDCGDAQSCFFSYDENHQPLGSGFCFSAHGQNGNEMAILDDSIVSEMIMLQESENEPDEAVKKFEPQGLKVSSLTVQAEEGKQAKVVLKSGSGAPFSLRVDGDVFALTKGADLDVLSVNSNGDVIAQTQVLAAGSLHAEKGFIVNDVPQWKLVYSEDFAKNDDASGFVLSDGESLSELSTSSCGPGLVMIGGFDAQLSSQEISKTYQNLPEHDQVMVKAVYHFIDNWNGESGYMKLSVGNDKGGDSPYVWTENLDVSDYLKTPNVCGSKDFGEPKFSSLVEVSSRHSADQLTVTFGSTLGSANDAWYGVSSVEVYVRNSVV